MLRITAPNQFVAVIDPMDYASPILLWMIKEKMDDDAIKSYASSKGWSVEDMPGQYPTGDERKGISHPDLKPLTTSSIGGPVI